MPNFHLSHTFNIPKTEKFEFINYLCSHFLFLDPTLSDLSDCCYYFRKSWNLLNDVIDRTAEITRSMEPNWRILLC